MDYRAALYVAHPTYLTILADPPLVSSHKLLPVVVSLKFEKHAIAENDKQRQLMRRIAQTPTRLLPPALGPFRLVWLPRQIEQPKQRTLRA